MNVNKLLSSTQGANDRLLDENKALVKKWERTGLLENLKSNRDKGTVAM